MPIQIYMFMQYAVLEHSYAILDKRVFGYSEKATKFEKIFHLKFDVTE